MFCQKCGKENADDAAFCNSCGTSLNKPDIQKKIRTCKKCGKPILEGVDFCPDCGRMASLGVTGNSADLQLKENEIRLLQEKFNNEASHTGPIVLAIVGVITAIFIVGIILIIAAWAWDNSKSAAATDTEIKLNAAKAELQKMKA